MSVRDEGHARSPNAVTRDLHKRIVCHTRI
jgi:hypothetical protein